MTAAAELSSPQTQARLQPWAAWLSLLVSLAFFLVMYLYFPFRDRFEFDTDEGLQLMKALLFSEGYPLYTQVWSDHPPLFTLLLAGCIRLFGFDVNAARTMTLVLSAGLLGAAFTYLRREWGVLHGLAGAFLVCLLPYYTSLSVSIMIGLPSIVFAVFSLLALAAWHRSPTGIWLVVSAVLMALSSLTKLFTAFLAPLFLAGILLQSWHRPGSGPPGPAWLRPAILWGGVYGLAVAGAIILTVGPRQLPQLVSIHLAARQAEVYASAGEAFGIHSYLAESWPVLILALGGLALAIARKNWITLYLAGWCGLAYALLVFHVPVFYHHQLLITIPAALLAGIAAGEAARWLLEGLFGGKFLLLQVILALALLAGSAVALLPRWRLTRQAFYLPADRIEPAAPKNGREEQFMDEIVRRAGQSRWMVTDLPIYAFRAGLPVPPSLAVISRKRLASGDLTEQKIIAAIQEYRPEQVLIGRFDLPELERSLEGEYLLVKAWGKKRLYAAKTMEISP